MTAGWDSTFPGGTLYYAQLSTNATFAAPLLSSNTLNLSASFSALTPNTTYYAQVATAPAGPFTALSSTVTWMQPPASVYFDEVTTHSIVASAYAPTPAFSNLNVGLSGTNLARDGVYAGWHGERWTTKAAMPTARYGVQAAAVNGRIYAIGGYNGTSQSTNAEFDPVTNVWTSKTAMPTARHSFALAALGGKLYAVGGENTGLLATHQQYDPATNAWTTKASLSPARTQPGPAVFDGKLHLFGGTIGTNLAYQDAYDPATNAWQSKTSMPDARNAMGVEVVGGKAYLIGGDTASVLAYNKAFDFGADSWVDRSTMPTARSIFAHGVIGGKIYALGGKDGTPTGTGVSEEYDPAADTWTARTPMPTPRRWMASAVVGGRLYAIGGSNGTTLAVNEEYDPGIAQQFMGLQPNTLYTFKAKARNLSGLETTETADFSTYTLAAPPVSVASSFTAVHITSATAQWAANGNPNGTLYRVHASTASDFGAYASSAASGWTSALTADIPSLSGYTTWYFRVQARNAALIETAFTSLGSTRTLVAKPAAAAPAFPGVFFSSLTVAWSGNGNGPGVTYSAQLSTAVDFSGVTITVVTTSLSATFSDLGLVTTYYARVSAVPDGTYVTLGATVTAVPPPAPSSAPFSGASTASLTANWGAPTFGPGTLFYAQLSSAPDFSGLVLSSNTYNLFATFAALSANTSYYGRVAASSTGPVTELGAGVTWMQPPASVYFDEITTHSIVASAYAPTPAFSNLNAGLSGTNLARDGVYAGWHGERWATKAAMPTARYGLQAAAVDGRIYAIGGYNGGNLSTNAEYDPAVDAWTAKAAMTTARHSFGIAVAAGKVYAFGGESTSMLSVNQEYDPAANSWSTKAAAPAAYAQIGTVLFGGRIHAFGGSNGVVVSSHVSYDPVGNSWQTHSQMPDARQEVGVDIVNGRAYVIGGEASTMLGIVREHDFAAGTWVAKSTMPTARGIFAHGVIGGKIYALGGRNAVVASRTAVSEEYDPAVDTWTVRTAMPAAREWMGSAVVAGRLYVIGGSNGSALATNEEYDPGVAQQFIGLAPNTQYSFKAKARNLHGLETAETDTVSTYTWAAVPAGAALAALGSSSAAFSWASGGNPSGTQFQAELSLSTSFASPSLSGWSADLSSAVFGGLSVGTTYYARVQARNAVGVPSGYTAVASTRTAYTPPTGCGLTRDVAKTGAPYGTIAAALAAVPASLTVDTCVVVRDSATYAEQVTVAGKTPNGFRLRIMADPALPAGATVAPPAASTAAFRIQTASVSLEGLTAAPAFPVGWGVYVTSPYASLSAVLVQTTVTLAVAGLELESWGRVEGSTVSVVNSRAVYFNGSSEHHNILSRSSFTNASAANHAVWCSGPDNTVEQSAVHNTAGVAVMLGATNCVVDRSTATTGAAGSYAVSFAAGSSSATFARGFARSGTGRGLSLAGSWHTVSESTVTTTGTSEYALMLTGLTHSTVSRVYAHSATGIPLHLSAGSNWNLIEQSTVVAGGAFSAAYIRASSQNAIAASLISAAGASALEVKEGSYGNAVVGTRLISGAAAGYALYLTSAAGNAVSDSVIYNSAGYAAFLGVNANANLIDRSTVTALVAGYSALYLDNASTNAITRSYLWNLAGTGVTFGAGASSNTLSQSTVAASGPLSRALSLFLAADSVIADSWLLGAGYGLYADLSLPALVWRSTVTGSGSVPAVMVAGSSGVVLRDSYAAGPDALSVYSSTATSLERTRLAATGASGKALQFLGGSNGLALASATLTAASYGLVFEDGARGPLAFSSFSVTASTGMRFEGGTLVATLTLGGFAGGPGANVDAAALSAASRLTLRDASGARAGSLFENDPLWVVDWLPDPNPVVFPDAPAGCASTLFVRQAAGFHCTRIQACVDLVPAGPLAGDACVVVADSGVYSERVVVRGKDTGGFRVRIEAAAGASPVLNPPAGSTAGLRVENSSVSVSGLAVVTTNTVAYGIVVSSPQVALSSISVDSGGKISGAGIFLSSGGALAYSSVTVQNADGVRVTGSSNAISFTSAAVTVFSRAAYYFNGASSNSLVDSYGSGSPGYGAFLYRSHGNTLARNTLRKTSTAGGAGLFMNDASLNTITGSFISNASGTGLDLFTAAHNNLIELSTITSAGSVYSGLEIGFASGNRISRVYVFSENGNAGAFSSGSSLASVEASTFTTPYPGAYALALSNQSSVSDCRLDAPNGVALYASDGVTVTRTTATSASPAYPALSVGGSTVSITESYFANADGDGGLLLRASYVDIARSTVSGAGAGAALRLEGSSSNTVTASRLAAPGGAGLAVGSYLELFDMSTVTGTGNAFAGLSILGSPAVRLTSARGVALSSSVLEAVPGGVSLEVSNDVLVATFTALSFSGGSYGVEALDPPAGSRLTVRDASGDRAGTLHEFDLLKVVDWVPDPAPLVIPPVPAGCDSVLFVRRQGGLDCTDIQACVDLIPATPLTGDFCVSIEDAQAYGKFAVRGKSPNGHRIVIGSSDPARRPVVRQNPGDSSPAVSVETASVTVRNLMVVPPPGSGEGIVVSSPNALVQDVFVDFRGAPVQFGAGISVSSWTTVLRASVVVVDDEFFNVSSAFHLRGVGSVVSQSTAVGSGADIFHLVWFDNASSNTVTNGYFTTDRYCSVVLGAEWLGVGENHYNTVSLSTITNSSDYCGALQVFAGTFNAFDRNFVSNSIGIGTIFNNASGPNYGNSVTRSTLTTGADWAGLYTYFADSFTLSDSWVGGPAGSALWATGGWLTVSRSTLTGGAPGATAFWKDQVGTPEKYDIVSDSYLQASTAARVELMDGFTALGSTFVGTAAGGDALVAVDDGGIRLLDSLFLSSGGFAAALTRVQGALIERSSFTASGSGRGLNIVLSSFTSVSDSYVQAATAVFVDRSSDVAVSRSRLSGTTAGLAASAGSGSLTVSSTSVTGALYGLSLSTPSSTAVVSVASLTFVGLAPGATAIQFLGGPYTSTFTAVRFDAADGINVDGRLLGASSRVTMRHASGFLAGPSFEADPLQVVDWSGTALPTPPAPSAPAGFSLGTSSISWSWTSPSGVWTFDVLSATSGSVLATVTSPPFVQTGLAPNATASLRLAVMGADGSVVLSPSATAHTSASPPAALAALFVTQSSAAVQWSLNGNPTGTFAELQRSTDAATFSVRAGTLATTAYDAGLVGCTSYYYRVRNRNPAGLDTDFAGPLFVRTPASTPAAPGDLSAQSVPGRRIALTWNPSATEGIVAYRLYKDSGAGQVDYSAPYAQFSGATFSTTTVALSSGVLHLFGLRAVHRCGVEEPNTHAVASAWALESLDGVRAGIKVPASGKKISGNRVLVMAEMDTGDPRDVSSVLFQYRSTGSAAWTDIPAANANHPNPDREQPFFVHWDVTGLADRAYDLRAVASDVVGASDPAPGTITVLVDSVGFEVRETDLGGGRVKKEQAVSNETANTVAAAESGSAVVTKVILPAGALNTTDATLSATPNPAALPPPPAAATALGASIEVTLSNGQSLLSGGQTAAIVFNYPDDDGDGVIDGTAIRAENAQIQTFDAVANAWKQEFATAVDKDKRTLTGRTPHFSFFAAFGVQAANLDAIRVYPNPYKPNGGNADEGRPFSRADPLSGVVFDNLPAVVDIKIYTLTGRLVSEFGTSAGTGALQWDGKNDRGEDVASGGYFAVITSPGASTVVKKIGVIR